MCTSKVLRSNLNIFLVGPVKEDFVPQKIPTNRETLQVFFFSRLVDKISIKESITATTNKIGKLLLENLKRKDAIKKEINRLFVTWRYLQSNKNRNNECDIYRREQFMFQLSESLNCTLVQPAADVDDENIHDETSVEFLNLTAEEGSSNGDEGRSRQKPKLLTPSVTAALDRIGMTDRNAGILFNALIKDKIIDSSKNSYAVNYSSIRRHRMKNRQKLTEEIRAHFKPNVPLTVHWDGKLLPDTKGKKVDRLPILVTGENISKLLAVPSLSKGTALIEATAIKDVIEDWGIAERVSAMCFDTTAVNSGHNMGVINQLPELLGKNMLALACRHHVAEIVLKHVFEVHGDDSKSSNFDDFKEFQKSLNDGSIETNKYRTVKKYPALMRLVAPWRSSIVDFCVGKLAEDQPRGDYEELLELVVMFLGEIPPKGAHFRKAGAISRARWMARAIYVLKMWMLGEQLDIDSTLMQHYKTLCVFIAQCYVMYWYRLTDAAIAPRVDLEFVKDLYRFKNQKYTQVAIRVFSNHLWYLTETTIALSFFDTGVGVEEKRKMVEALHKPKMFYGQSSANTKKRKIEDQPFKPPKRPTTVSKSSLLSDFVTEETNVFFDILEIGRDFLESDPAQWNKSEEYLIAQKRVSALHVVNDIAERAVKMATDFNGKLTKNSEQEQYLLHVIEQHRSLN